MHPILSKLDDIEADLTRLPDRVPEAARAAVRGHIFEARSKLGDYLCGPAPGSTEIVHGAKITHRPDLVDTERARQAAAQGDADRGQYAPVREALAKSTHVDTSGGFVQAPEPERPAEIATIGIERR